MKIKIGTLIELKEAKNERFIVTKVLTGGFGIVYFLKSLGSRLPNCAMKTFKTTVRSEEIFREALLWSRIGHNRNIAQFICFGEFENQFYILSPRYEATLDDCIDHTKNYFSVRSILIDMVEGLDFAYRRMGLIHRDIKPANIYIDNGNAKIGDFGFSSYAKKQKKINLYDEKLYEEIVHSEQDYGGTIPFMAPEVLLEEGTFSISTDIYALGVTIFQMLTQGGFPYYLPHFKRNEMSFDKLEAVTDKQLANTVLKCISLDANLRYSDYNSLLQDLNEPPSSYDEHSEIESVINYIQTLRRTGQTLRASAVIDDMLKLYPDHPLIINQKALVYLLSKDKKAFVELLKKITTWKYNYPIEYYFDPICNLASYYFEENNFSQVRHVMKPICTEIENRPEFYTQYPEYGVFLYLEGKYEEAYTVFLKMLQTRNIASKAVLLYIYLGEKLGRRTEVLSIISTKREGISPKIAEFCENNPKNIALVASQFKSEFLEA